MRPLAFAAALLVTTALACAIPAHAQRGGTRTHARGGRGTGVPCGRSYISADKTCHVGVNANSAPDTASRAVSEYRLADTHVVVDEIPADGAERARCAADSANSAQSIATHVRVHGRAPECLRSRPTRPQLTTVPGGPPSPDTAVQSSPAIHDVQRYAVESVSLRFAPYATAQTVATVPRGGGALLSSCAVGADAWCLFTYGEHTGYAPSRWFRPNPLKGTTPRAAARPRVPRLVATPPGHSGYFVGPRGGCYTYSASGRKRYVDHRYCS